jgi:hypothetical protein
MEVIMKYWIMLGCLLLVLVGNGLSQTAQTPSTSPPASSPPAQSGSGNSGGQGQGGTQVGRSQSRSIDAAFENLRMLEILNNGQRSRDTVMNEEVHPLYRKPSKKDLKTLLPAQSLLTQYEQFLKQPETGIFKLSADAECVNTTKVVTAKENCLLNNLPGGGTAYSFRVKSHRLQHLSDVVLEKDVIKTDSILQQGIMVKLGNVELETITAQTAGLKFLFDFKPALNQEELIEIDDTLSKGIKADGFVYAYGFFVDNQTTFALRSIAYRGNIQRSISGVKYNELDFDKRKDVIVVFRILEKDANGDLTILWKEISRQDSPVIKISEKDKEK